MDNGIKHILTYKGKMQTNQLFKDTSNPDLEIRTKRVGDKISENVHIIANEPSLAFYRIQEHVRKSLPQLVDKKHEIEDINQQIQGASFDTEYAINAMSSMEKSTQHFQSVQSLLKNSLFIKQQLQYEQNRKQQQRIKPSMYRPQSMMSRTQTLDIGATGGRESPAEFSHGIQMPGRRSLENSPQAGRARSSSLSSKIQQ